MAFDDAFEMAFTIKHDIEDIMKYSISLSMFTDNCSLFGVLKISFTTRKKRVMINLQTVWDAYQSFRVNDVAFISSEDNIVDAVTDLKEHSAVIDTLNHNKLDHPVKQWIVGEKGMKYKSFDKESGNIGLWCVIIS